MQSAVEVYLIAPRILPNRLRRFVDWLIGSLVSLSLGSALPSKEPLKGLQSGCLEVFLCFEGLKTAAWMACWLQACLERAKLSPTWPNMALRWAQEGSQNYLGSSGHCASPRFGLILGPSWAILGPPWPFSGGPGGHLEADFGFGRLDIGVQGG